MYKVIFIKDGQTHYCLYTFQYDAIEFKDYMSEIGFRTELVSVDDRDGAHKFFKMVAKYSVAWCGKSFRNTKLCYRWKNVTCKECLRWKADY